MDMVYNIRWRSEKFKRSQTEANEEQVELEIEGEPSPMKIECTEQSPLRMPSSRVILDFTG